MICDRKISSKKERYQLDHKHPGKRKRNMWKATPVTVDPPLEDVCPHTYERKRKRFFIQKNIMTKKKYHNEKKKTYIKIGKRNKKEKNRKKRTCSEKKIRKKTHRKGKKIKSDISYLLYNRS
jgi:hypothetical protein